MTYAAPVTYTAGYAPAVTYTSYDAPQPQLRNLLRGCCPGGVYQLLRGPLRDLLLWRGRHQHLRHAAGLRTGRAGAEHASGAHAVSQCNLQEYKRCGLKTC